MNTEYERLEDQVLVLAENDQLRSQQIDLLNERVFRLETDVRMIVKQKS
ncbi:hypothetical protein MO973_26345 [Paenibacillus sp. TRM 82003]|nr:hypothetical protein [Paenibacillus sp. TRM 82003]